MKANAIKEFLDCLGVDNAYEKDGWVHCSCPLAPWNHSSQRDSNPSFGVRIVDAGPSYFNCWSCGGGSSLEYLLSELRRLGAGGDKYQLAKATDIFVKELSYLGEPLKTYADLQTIAQADPTVEFPQMWLDSFMRALEVPKARTYLRGRGLSDETIEFFDIRWDTKREVVAFPLYDRDKGCIGLHGRYLQPIVTEKGGSIRYHSYASDNGSRNKSAWLGEWYLNEDIPVVLVEGPFDVAAVYPSYPNVISPLVSGMNKAKVERMAMKMGHIITFFDSGDAGEKARRIINKRFGKQVIAELVPTEGRDPGDYKPEELNELLEAVL